MRRDPDVELCKAGFQSLLQGDEKLPAFCQIGDVHEEADEVVPVGLPFLTPDAADVLRLARNSAELLFELQDRLGQQWTGFPSLNRSGSRTS